MMFERIKKRQSSWSFDLVDDQISIEDASC